MIKKLSFIRGSSALQCPYGLPITSACGTVGDTILQMQVLSTTDEDKIEQVSKKNKVIYLTQQLGERCPFANEIMKKFDKVDCSWGDTAAGEGTHYLTPSPLYPRTFIGDGVSPGTRGGDNITDPRLYFDEPQRGIDVPFGLFSIFSSLSNEQRLIRIAEKYTNKIPNIKESLALLRDKYFSILKSIIPSSSIIKLNNEQLEKLLFVINDWTQ